MQSPDHVTPSYLGLAPCHITEYSCRFGTPQTWGSPRSVTNFGSPTATSYSTPSHLHAPPDLWVPPTWGSPRSRLPSDRPGAPQIWIILTFSLQKSLKKSQSLICRLFQDYFVTLIINKWVNRLQDNHNIHDNTN